MIMKLFQSIKAHCQKTAKDMKGMTFKEKADHLWTYYKEYAFVVIMVLIIVGGVIISLLTPVPTLVSSGSLVNVSLTMEGHDHLTDVFYKDVLGSPDGKIALTTANYSTLGTVDAVDASYQAYMGVTAKVEAKELDYLLMDQVGLNYYGSQDMLMDLRRILPEEELRQLDAEGHLGYAAKEDLASADLMQLYLDGRVVFLLEGELTEEQLRQMHGEQAFYADGKQLSVEELLERYAKKSPVFTIYKDVTEEDLWKRYEADSIAFDIKGEMTAREDVTFDVMADSYFLPIAINLSGLKFAQEAIQTEMPVYLVFIDNTPNFATCQKLWEHIKNWQ